jgi:ABC-type transport system substrate-binding protein
MKHNKFMLVCGLILIASMLLTACQPQTIIQTVEVTKEVQVVQTQVVEKSVEKVVESTKVVEVEKKSFTTPHPILGDLKVRQAMAYCTNKLELLQAAYPLLSDDERKPLVMDTFIPKKHWAYAGDENVTIYNFDVEKGKKLFDDAGWKLAEGADFRANDKGETLAVKFTTTDAAFRKAWAAVWEQQMAACGVQIIRQHVPASWWFGDSTGLKRRDYELGAFAWVGQVDPGGQTLYACDQIPTVENNWTGQNGMGWCNQAASDGIKKANNTLIQADRIAQYKIVQQEFTKDVPSIPLFNRADFFAMNPKLEGLNPLVNGDGNYTYNAEEWFLPGKDTIVFGTIQEPSTLLTIITDAMTAKIAIGLVSGIAARSENFAYSPNLQKEMSTLESGLAKNAEVDVKAGDLVVDADGNATDADGNPLALKAGVKVIDSTGATVEYKDGTVKMKQLTVTYNWVDGLTFPDGHKLAKEDLELGYKYTCDRTNGATSFITCDQIQSYAADSDTSYTTVYKPGAQPATYYLAPFGWWEAGLKLSDGRLLKDVPPADWGKTPEVSEKITDVGPYMVSEWKKGESITFVPNPHYFKGEPKTKKIVIKILTAENAESQLLTGDVDFLDSLTLTSVSETLKKAADDGKVKLLVLPQATWEHIDINMYLR